MFVNNLSKVALDSTAAGIEPAISSRKSNALTTAPPSHKKLHQDIILTTAFLQLHMCTIVAVAIIKRTKEWTEIYCRQQGSYDTTHILYLLYYCVTLYMFLNFLCDCVLSTVNKDLMMI